MVLPASPAHAQNGQDWLAPLKTALALNRSAVLLRIEQAVDGRIGELVRALLPEHPDLELLLDPEPLLTVPEGSLVVLVPALRDADWLNVNRPVLQRRGLRVILWCDAETTRTLPQLAPDFCDWISHSWQCPPAPAGDTLPLVQAALRLKQAGAKRPAMLAARLSLDRCAIERALSLIRHNLPEAELVTQALASSQTVASPPARTSSHRHPAPSPFIAGPPLPCGSPAFVGRYEAIHQIQQCLELGQPVQLLGEPRMGKTSLLNQVAQWLPTGVRAVSLTAQGNCGTSERELVACVAEQLGRTEIASDLRIGKTTDACGALEELTPFALLLDEADALTKPGHQFSADFLDQCRALGQLRRLFFVCAARSDLEVRFGVQGLTSRFLNDSRRIWVGQLEPEAREELLELAPQLTREQREFALEQTGGFAIALQWVGDALVNGMSLDTAADQLRLEMDRYFPTWWQGCSPGEQRLLRVAVRGVERAPLTNGERRSLRALVSRGLAEESEKEFTLPGNSWREFVGEQ